MKETIESEKKRLISLKEKRESFKTKEQLVRDALNNTGNKRKNKKIVFDKYNDNENRNEDEEFVKRKIHKQLFDTVEDDIINDEFNFENIGNKQSIIGNDVRFTLDKRFTEDDNKHNETGVSEENDIQNEKDWQLNILEDVLGMPIAAKSNTATSSAQKKTMIRYDPSKSTHSEYEVKVDKTQLRSKKKTKVSSVNTELQEVPVIVSKDVYYTTSNKLSQSLKKDEEFSIRKIYGKETNDSSNQNYDVPATKPYKNKFQFEHNTLNAFEFGSFDDNDIKEPRVNTDSKVRAEKCNLFDQDVTFFFQTDDTRFEDARKFFSKHSIPTEKFTEVRRELKKIVREKVRNHIKNAPSTWDHQQKIKKSS